MVLGDAVSTVGTFVSILNHVARYAIFHVLVSGHRLVKIKNLLL